jgi:NADH-quinone oxidoreductase E subunit
MSAASTAQGDFQPASFEFTPDYRAKADKIIAKYPEGRQASAVIPLLDLAQRQAGGWVPRAAMDHIGEILDMAFIRVYEVATFYTKFNLKPTGKHHLQVCTTTPCWLRNSDAVIEACHKKLGIRPGETTADGAFSLIEVECLGACVNAPMLQLGDDYFEDLDSASTVALIEALQRGEKPKPGPQIARQTSAPVGGPTTLTSNAGAE